MKKEFVGSIVELNVSDLSRCAHFWDIPSKLAEPIRNGEKKAFAYKINDCFVGGCALSIKDDYGHFSYFSVAPCLRGNGIGSCIMDFAIKYFKNLGMNKMQLHVDKNNSNAIKLYEKKGFSYTFDVTPERIAMTLQINNQL